MRLAPWLLDAASRWSARPALRADGRETSFGETFDRARAVECALRDLGAARVAVVGSGTLDLHAAFLGCLLGGVTFVPLSAAQPPERMAYALNKAQVDLALFEPGHADLFGAAEGWDLEGPLPGADGLRHARRASASPNRAENSPCYVMFTSGSSGAPKAVPIPESSLLSLLTWALRHYDARETDSWIQTFDPSFDLSLFAPLVAWLSGGALVYPKASSPFALPAAVQEHAISCWFSVPTTAALLCRLGFPELPSLRLSMFCGEPLPWSVASAWRARCPNSIIENVYGPTEATLFCSTYRIDPAQANDGADGSWVPIGKALPQHEFLILDAEGAAADRGELLVAGPQVFDGYLGETGANLTAFRTIGGARHYRTGDIASRRGDGEVCFEGREDRQVKLNGYRVELAEVEQAMRSVPGVSWALAYCRAESPSAAPTLEAKAVGDAAPDAIFAALKAKLPAYMTPKRIEVIAAPPRLASGKIDAKALLAGDG